MYNLKSMIESLDQYLVFGISISFKVISNINLEFVIQY